MRRAQAPLIALLAIICFSVTNAFAQAGGISGKITDVAKAAVEGAKVTLTNPATQAEHSTVTDGSGRYQFKELAAGPYLLRVEKAGFSAATRDLTLAGGGAEADIELAPGSISANVSVTAKRGERDPLEIDVRAETVSQAVIERLNITTTQDTLGNVPNITVVGNGPFQQRPRFRGLDSTRVLTLVDGERLNTTRVATDRAGPEIGLVDPSNIQSVEVISGSGSALYGTDALTGVINIRTEQPERINEKIRVGGGLNLFYSGNEDGRRGTARFDAAGRKFAVRFSGMRERWPNYHSGNPFGEASAPFINPVRVFSDTPATALRPPPGFITQQIFGGVFPDNFNAPFARTNTEVPNSQAHGSAVNGVGRLFFTDHDVLRVSWNRRRNGNIGFADFAQPIFFQRISLPFSNLDKYGLRYERRGLTSWFTGLTISAYHQVQDRNLRNDFSAFSLSGPSRGADAITQVDVLSDTRQNVKSYGYDVQANFLLSPRNILTAGTSFFRDHSRDSRVSQSRGRIVGLVLRPPAPPGLINMVIPLFNTLSFPQRVPKSNYDNYAFFVQDEYDVTKRVRLLGGLRVDRFDIASLATPGYNPLLPGLDLAVPAIDLARFPSVNGTQINRTTVTGDAGVVVRATDYLSIFGRVGRSYRHPNLEELFFTGPATVGNIIANTQVKPETGINVDVGAKLRKSRYAASFTYFNNTYRNFISTEFVTRAPAPTGLIAQALNFARLRIQGFETDAESNYTVGRVVLTPFITVGYLHGEILAAVNPFNNSALRNVPADNIPPLKAVAGLRWQTTSARFWGEYNVRAQSHVERVSPLLSDSPFLIAQDLFGLRGFGVQTLRGGLNFTRERSRVLLALGLENLANEFYREQFQFAPARGRSITVGLVLRFF